MTSKILRNAEANGGELVHSPSKKPLSKSQQQFNRLTQQATSLKEDIDAGRKTLEELLSLYQKDVAPMLQQMADCRYKLAVAMGRATERFSFTRGQHQDISSTICHLCDEAFEELDPTPEMEAFYDQWARLTFREQQNEELYRAKQMFADMMYNRYEVTIDIEDIEDSTEGFEHFKRRHLEQQQQARQQFWSEQGAKSRRQQAKEQAVKAAQEQQAKSIRSIYIALAKVLHPDGESDPLLQKQKEEVMKQVTVAYEQGDLSALLRLEMEWIQQTKEGIERYADDQIKDYIEVLRQQVSELQAQKVQLYHAHQYQPIAAFADMPYSIASSRMAKHRREVRDYMHRLTSITSAIRGADSKRYLLDFVASYLQQID